MAYTAILVSEQRLKQWTALDENVRVEEITPFIINAQDIYMQDTLGTRFYTRLKNGIINNDLNSDEQELLNEYVAPCLMQYALYLMLPTIKYKIVEKGILSGTSEETAATSLEELKYLRETTLDMAEFYNKRLVEFLVDYPGKFPEYATPGVKGMHPNKQTPYFSGLVTSVKKNKYYDETCNDCGYIEGPAIEN
jgi:hypothetical protein